MSQKFAKTLVLFSFITLLFSVFFYTQYATSTVATAFEGEPYEVFLPVSKKNVAPPPIAMEVFATGFSTDTIIDIAHDGQRLYVVEREGEIRIVEMDGTLIATSFLNIKSLVGLTNWEEGMLGLVFHPNYPTTPYFYVSYTDVNHRINIVRYTRSADPDYADPDSRFLLMHIAKSGQAEGIPSPVHNAGDMAFGEDGYLYIAVGDGGPDPTVDDGDPYNNGQSLDSLLGKILRIDVNNTTGIAPDCGNTTHYSIPPDNPYIDGPVPNGPCDEIWASGLRNPWRFSFDTERDLMFIGDVGEAHYEEVNIVSTTSSGYNFGWHCWEGFFDYTQHDPGYSSHCLPFNQYTPPTYAYQHVSGDGTFQGCSIVGGFVYRGTRYPRLRGHYIFGDFCNGSLRILTKNKEWEVFPQGGTGFHISTFGEGPDGEIYAGNWPEGDAVPTLYHVYVP